MTLRSIFKPDLIVILGVFIVPIPSNQHFIWPLSWCLLADFCNHTWIPECGRDELQAQFRVFTDECDLFEYNCDNDMDYEIVNYSDCFSNKQSCQTAMPCPSKPSCPDHRFHRMGQRYVFVGARRMNRLQTSSPLPLSSRHHKHIHHVKNEHHDKHKTSIRSLRGLKKKRRSKIKQETNLENKIYSGFYNRYKNKPHYGMPLIRATRFGSKVQGSIYLQKTNNSSLLLNQGFSQGLSLKQILNLLDPTREYNRVTKLQRMYNRADEHTVIVSTEKTPRTDPPATRITVLTTPIIDANTPGTVPTIQRRTPTIPTTFSTTPITPITDLTTTIASTLIDTGSKTTSEAATATNTITTTKYHETTSDPSLYTVVLKRDVVMRFGKKMIRVVKGFWRDSQINNSNDEIEKTS